jgi:hypothetical protein
VKEKEVNPGAASQCCKAPGGAANPITADHRARPVFLASFLDFGRLIFVKSRKMLRKSTFVLSALVAILLLQFADCMSAMPQDQQTMQCCGSMPCDRSNQSHECCKTMVSSQSPSVLPASHITLHPPAMMVAGVLAPQAALAFSHTVHSDFAVPEYSPPELYTLHSSFLI